MAALTAICWAVALLLSAFGIYATWGNAQLVGMFPEGRRWWHPWVRLLSLALYAGVVLANPFNGWLA